MASTPSGARRHGWQRTSDLEFKSASQHGDEQGLSVAIGVGDDEVLAASLTNDAWVGFQVLEVVGRLATRRKTRVEPVVNTC